MIEIPDYLPVSYMRYEFDGYEFDFQPLKFPDLYPMWQRAVFIKGPGLSCIARIDDGHVHWGGKLPSLVCRYYIEAIVAKEYLRVSNFWDEKYRAKKISATLDSLIQKIMLLGPDARGECRRMRKDQ